MSFLTFLLLSITQTQKPWSLLPRQPSCHSLNQQLHLRPQISLTAKTESDPWQHPTRVWIKSDSRQTTSSSQIWPQFHFVDTTPASNRPRFNATTSSLSIRRHHDLAFSIMRSNQFCWSLCDTACVTRPHQTSSSSSSPADLAFILRTHRRSLRPRGDSSILLAPSPAFPDIVHPSPEPLCPAASLSTLVGAPPAL